MVDHLNGGHRANGGMTQGSDRPSPASPHSNVLYLKIPHKQAPKPGHGNPAARSRYVPPSPEDDVTLVHLGVMRRRALAKTEQDDENVHTLPMHILMPDFDILARLDRLRAQGASDLASNAAKRYPDLLSQALSLFKDYTTDTYWLIASPHFYLVDPNASNDEAIHRWEQGKTPTDADLAAMDLVDEDGNSIYLTDVRARMTNIIHGMALPYEDIASIAVDMATLGSHLFQAIPLEEVDGNIEAGATSFIRSANAFLARATTARDTKALSYAIQRVQPYVQSQGMPTCTPVLGTPAPVVRLKPVHK